MKAIPRNAETEALARRLIWFEPPAEALADPVRLLAYAFEHATLEDFAVLRRYVSDTELREALAAAPPGIIGPRSWAYWHARLRRGPAPAMPRRELGPVG
jgi:hypothetical protein